jgi:hypothetical protein
MEYILTRASSKHIPITCMDGFGREPQTSRYAQTETCMPKYIMKRMLLFKKRARDPARDALVTGRPRVWKLFRRRI